MAGWHHWVMDMSLSEFQELVMDREAWRAAIHGFAKSRTWLRDRTFVSYVPCIGRTHSIFKRLSLIYWLYSPFWLLQSQLIGTAIQPLSHVRFFETPWTTALQASLSITNCWSLLKLMSIESVMPSNHLILCCPFLLPPSIFPSIRVISNQSVLSIR